MVPMKSVSQLVSLSNFYTEQRSAGNSSVKIDNDCDVIFMFKNVMEHRYLSGYSWDKYFMVY